MREALARSHHDVVVYDRPTPRGRKPEAKRKSAARRLPRLGRLLFSLCAVGLAGGVIANALLMQTGQHPAPLFAPQAAAPAVASHSMGATRAVGRAIGQPSQPPSLAPLADETAPPPPPPASSRSRDIIGDLIRGGGAPKVPADATRPAAAGIVMSGQRALTKLGYGPLKADGVAGPGTRTALERFERDKALPVTGEFGPRTIKALASAAGMAIE
ncbi:peptidoglycan-binding domain-containing protein [Chelatococcus reniformis]|uniref:Peptidoglycan binding-like domain-containing protein n=1 Tax=Chelatococcus reniformis TaxID=1494448 RepID=A0A916UK05_9HYPH|nr:peptidoglycan-binding domain-containing protein [Chelatococcus reniformis]GGC73722.1 hypothetical protein GCM10010994_35120 [Chelatococcus reniformis]